MMKIDFIKSDSALTGLVSASPYRALEPGIPAPAYRTGRQGRGYRRAFSFIHIIIITSLFLFSLTPLLAQSKYNGLPSLIWPKLYDIRFEKVKDNLGEYDKPIFSQAAKSLEGKVVSLPGYMIPFENGMKGTTFMLSSLPINACFFCGVGGPESVVEVILKEPISFTEKPIEIKGILRLNNKNPDRMIYRIEQAEYLGEVDF